jgi:hypothetical protein
MSVFNGPISIAFHGVAEIDRAAVLFSSRAVMAKDSIYSSGYLPHAFIPAMQWSSLRDEDYERLNSSVCGDILSTVCVVKFENEHVEKLINLVAYSRQKEVPENLIESMFKSVIADQVTVNGDYRYLGVETTKDSSPTLTWELDGRRTGLHVDSWYDRKIVERKSSPNRLCLNVGAGDRYFLMINAGIDAIQARLMDNRLIDDENKENVTGLTSAFLYSNPNVPVIAVRTRPGEAYIAPTEYIIHDGFVPSRLANSSISIMGNIDVRRTCSMAA